MYMDEFKNGANTLNVGTSAEDLLLELAEFNLQMQQNSD